MQICGSAARAGAEERGLGAAAGDVDAGAFFDGGTDSRPQRTSVIPDISIRVAIEAVVLGMVPPWACDAARG
jgi:hypothetical protein